MNMLCFHLGLFAPIHVLHNRSTAQSICNVDPAPRRPRKNVPTTAGCNEQELQGVGRTYAAGLVEGTIVSSRALRRSSDTTPTVPPRPHLVGVRHAVPPRLLQLAAHLVFGSLRRGYGGGSVLLEHRSGASAGLHGGEDVVLAVTAAGHAFHQSLHRGIEE